MSRGMVGNQIPSVEGVVGGVPRVSPVSHSATGEVKVVLAGLGTNGTWTAGKLRYVENSGLCETTPGVYQASGYADLTKTKSLWFCFFAARNNSDGAPLTLWFNGGPGASSMIGLFQENGPCRITNDSSKVVPNLYSWNNFSNVLYIDQPAGVGFSHGPLTGPNKVATSQEAADDIWNFMQIFLEDVTFKKFNNIRIGIWTESYGGHYGPTFAAHFLRQNMAIEQQNMSSIKLEGNVTAKHLNMQTLAIGNGLTDPLTQYSSYLTYAAYNHYHPLVSQNVINEASDSWTSSEGCRDGIIECNTKGPWNHSLCSDVQLSCNAEIFGALSGDYNSWFVPNKDPDPYPPSFGAYLNSIASQLGARGNWTMASDDVYANFAATGDWMRSSKEDLEFVINSEVRTLIYDGDADFTLNFMGVENMCDHLNTTYSSLYLAQNFTTYNVQGQPAGVYKNAGRFSYVRIYGAGHEVPAYKYGSLDYGQAAAQIFAQIMSNDSLSST